MNNNKREFRVQVCACVPITLKILVSVDMNIVAEQGGDPCNAYEVLSVEPSPYNEFSPRTVSENFKDAELDELDSAVLSAMIKEPEENEP